MLFTSWYCGRPPSKGSSKPNSYDGVNIANDDAREFKTKYRIHVARRAASASQVTLFANGNVKLSKEGSSQQHHPDRQRLGRSEAFFTGELTSPEFIIEYNSVGFDQLVQTMHAAHSVGDHTFDLLKSRRMGPSTRMSSFNIGLQRKFE